MGLETVMRRGEYSTCRYHRLRGEMADGDEVGSAGRARPRRLRLRRRGRGKGRGVLFRMAPSSKRMRLLFVVPLRRVAALYAEFLRRLASAADVAGECPTIVFSSQWGLPVLSHSAASPAGRSARLRAFYLERSLSAGGGGGSAS